MEQVAFENKKLGRSFVLAWNEFSDLSNDEFSAKYVGGYKPDMRSQGLTATPWVDPP